MNKIVVAIHGIGNQRRCGTVRSVATQFGNLRTPPLAVKPLGFFNLGGDDHVVVSKLTSQSTVRRTRLVSLRSTGPMYLVILHGGDTLGESKAWARTVAGRARQLYEKEVLQDRLLQDKDFEQAAAVIEEIAEGVGVLVNLFAVAAKAWIFKFDLGPLLSDYVGGVQLVADFEYYRKDIVGRFHHTLTEIVSHSASYCGSGELEIYVVAHSEGTVVSFAAMMEALLLSGERKRKNAPEDVHTDWIKYVRGLMTFGSPLDKHLASRWRSSRIHSGSLYCIRHRPTAQARTH